MRVVVTRSAGICCGIVLLACLTPGRSSAAGGRGQSEASRAGASARAQTEQPRASATAWAGVLPQAALQRTKAATVFVRVDAKEGEVQGTGFFAGRRGLVLTNAHVATPADAGDRGIRVVLRSGTPAERTLPARVIATDPTADMALLQVDGPDLPEPLPLSGAEALAETELLYTFGFPFGDGLAAQGCNPELSVLRTSVSCLRHTAAGVLEMIQLDGELNPGNSGGPIVDGQGRVVGMTVSRLRAARIGFAIPGERLRGMLRTQMANAGR
jgi:serine protease Do